jgi:hypothetical protein
LSASFSVTTTTLSVNGGIGLPCFVDSTKSRSTLYNRRAFPTISRPRVA